MFETNLLVQVSSYPQENIPLSSEYNIIHPYAKQYVLKNAAKDCSDKLWSYKN